MTLKFTIEDAAHVKIMLHAAKYSQTAVHGLLIGRSGEEASSILDVIPLFHSEVPDPVSVEVAFEQVSYEILIDGSLIDSKEKNRQASTAKDKASPSLAYTMLHRPSLLLLHPLPCCLSWLNLFLVRLDLFFS